jgi:alkylhydroperoxidase family enzyme
MTPPTNDSRVPRLPVNEAKAAADEAGVPDYMAELAIFQVLLNHPKLACALNELLATMLWRGKLDSRLRELLIMRIGWLTASEYEWTQHWRVAQGLGVTADDLLGVRDWQAHNSFGPTERAVLAATDDVVRDGAVSAESWAACQREFGWSSWSPRSARGEWSLPSCTACKSRWKTAWRAGRRTASHRRNKHATPSD